MLYARLKKKSTRNISMRNVLELSATGKMSDDKIAHLGWSLICTKDEKI